MVSFTSIATRQKAALEGEAPRIRKKPSRRAEALETLEYEHPSTMPDTSEVNDQLDFSKREVSTGRGIHRGILRVQKDTDVYEKYEIVRVIGKGSMGHVSEVRIKDTKLGGSAFGPKKRTGVLSGIFGCCHSVDAVADPPRFAPNQRSKHEHIYALKSIHLDRISPVFIDELKNEIAILRSMDHANIVKAFEVFMTSDQIYLVLEACDGDLYTRAPYSERDSARIISQICSAVAYMHERSIVHRDLKFENIMFESTAENAAIKVIDFGLSKKFLGRKGYMTERVGTIYTMSPQVLQGVYSSQADLWAIGVVAYMCLSTSKPFYSKHRRRMIDMIMRGNVEYDKPGFTKVSETAIDFCKHLLVVDPKERLSAVGALQHPWIVKREQLLDELPDKEVLEAIDDCLVHYKHTSQLKKLALNVIAHRSTTAEIFQLRKIFESFDKQHDGVLSFAEFKEGLIQMGIKDDEAETIFSSVNVNENGHIMYTEFLAATIEAHGHIEEDRIAEAFDRLDSDDTGFISRDNLVQALGKRYTKEEVDAIMESADLNHDGKISYPEFLASFRAQTLKIHHECNEELMSTASSSHATSHELLGLDAKIPGGRYDSELSDSLRDQLED